MAGEQDTWGFPNRHLPDGSAAYYLARFSAPHERDAVANMLAFFSHLDEIVSKAVDPGVCRLKLDWWRTEIDALPQGETRHPLAAALAPQVWHAWQLEALQALLDAAEQRVLRRLPASKQSLYDECMLEGSARARLLAGPDTDAEARDSVADAGAYALLLQRLLAAPGETQRGHCPFGTPLLAAFELREDVMLQAGMQDRLSGMLGELLDAHPYAVPRQDRLPSPVDRLLAQANAMARKWRRQGFPPIHDRPPLSPISLLWHTWRGR